MKIKKQVLLALLTFFCFACAGAPVSSDLNTLTASGSRVVAFTAKSMVFSGGKLPTVVQKSLKGTLAITVRAAVKSYKFKIKFDDNPADEIEVMVAISGQTAGFGVYSKGLTLTEYPKGRVIGNAVFFESKTENGSSNVTWLLGGNVLSSVIEARTTQGDITYSEVTTYTLQ